jgi:KUP system potassium uptake protein
LHEQIVVLRVVVKSVPRVPPSQRLSITEKSPHFWRAVARYGFMEHPNIPQIMQAFESEGFPLDLSDLTYYVGRDTIVGREDGKGIPAWQKNLFAMMERNAAQIGDFFSLPCDDVVEIGRQISI